VKRKSPGRLKSELWRKLRPEIDSNTLVNAIADLLHKQLGKSARNVNVAHNLVQYLTQKYSVSSRKTGKLRELIEHYPEDLAAFLERITFKKFQLLEGKVGQLPQTKKKARVRAQTEAEAARRRKKAKNRYEHRRRAYREGLIIEDFGKFPPFGALDPHSRKSPERTCLDILLNGGAISMAGHWNSFENLFGVDRHRFPKSLPRTRKRRNVVYSLDAFVKCLIHLLANRDGDEQWLPEPTRRDLVLRGIIERGHRLSPEIGEMLAEKLSPYLR
jgi:hypothetical protein